MNFFLAPQRRGAAKNGDRLLRFLALAAIGAAALHASSTTTWEMNSYQDFIRGRFQGISLSRYGRLLLAPKMLAGRIKKVDLLAISN